MNRCFESIYPRAEPRHRFSVFIVNFKHISHLALVFLLLILSMCLIPGFDISYFSRFQITMNCSFIAYLFLERTSKQQNISTKWNAPLPPLALIVKTRYVYSVPQLQDFFWGGGTRKIKNVVGLLYSKFLRHMRNYIKYKVRGFP